MLVNKQLGDSNKWKRLAQSKSVIVRHIYINLGCCGVTDNLITVLNNKKWT